MSSESSEKREGKPKKKGRDERWKKRTQREREIENTLEKFAERYHK